MSDDAFNREDAVIGFNEEGPLVMVITLPLDAYMRDKANGMALFYGKLKEAEAIGARRLLEARAKHFAGGIVRTGPIPLRPV